MYTIQLKKKSNTKTSNNSYDILLKKDKNRLPIGSYNQAKMIVTLDLESYIFAITKGCLISENFKKIFIKTTMNFSNKKNINSLYNNTIKTGTVLYIKYLLLKEDEIKISSFIGLCVVKKRKSNTLVLKNNIKKESIKLIINAHSPLIISIKIIRRYKKKFRLSKLYYK